MTGRFLAVAGCLAFALLLNARTYYPPQVIDSVDPVYPSLAKRAHISGTVRLAVAIDRDGTVAGVRLIGGHPLLVKAAMDAVKQWRFRPAVSDGVPVRAVTQVGVRFSLDDTPRDDQSPVVRV